MPVNRKKMSALKAEYGKDKGENIYYAMENKAKAKKKSVKASAKKSIVDAITSARMKK